MRRFPLAALLTAAAMLTAGCDRTADVQGRARTAVLLVLAAPGVPAFDFRHTDAGAGVACGVVSMGGPNGAAQQTPFIVRGRAAEIYPPPPTWGDVRQLGGVDSGLELEQLANLRLNIDDGCAFPQAWKQACSPAASPTPPPDPELCRLWKAGDFRQLFDHNRQ
jgi:hypothetical protein